MDAAPALIDYGRIADTVRALRGLRDAFNEIWGRATNVPLIDDLRWDRIRAVHVKLLLGNLVLMQARLTDLGVFARVATDCLGVDDRLRDRLDAVVGEVCWLLGEHSDLMVGLSSPNLTCDQIGDLYGELDVPQMDTRLDGLCARAERIVAEVSA